MILRVGRSKDFIPGIRQVPDHTTGGGTESKIDAVYWVGLSKRLLQLPHPGSWGDLIDCF